MREGQDLEWRSVGKSRNRTRFRRAEQDLKE